MFTYFVSFVLQSKTSVAEASGDTVLEVAEPITDQASLDQLRETLRQHLHAGDGILTVVTIVNFILLKSPAVGVT